MPLEKETQREKINRGPANADRVIFMQSNYKNITYTHIHTHACLYIKLRKSVNNFFIYFDCIICQFRKNNNQIIEMKREESSKKSL